MVSSPTDSGQLTPNPGHIEPWTHFLFFIRSHIFRTLCHKYIRIIVNERKHHSSLFHCTSVILKTTSVRIVSSPPRLLHRGSHDAVLELDCCCCWEKMSMKILHNVSFCVLQKNMAIKRWQDLPLCLMCGIFKLPALIWLRMMMVRKTMNVILYIPPAVYLWSSLSTARSARPDGRREAEPKYRRPYWDEPDEKDRCRQMLIYSVFSTDLITL